MERSDRELTCVQCGQVFNFTGGEQDYFLQNQLQDPRRCKPCRGARKNAGGEQPQGNPQRMPPRNNAPTGQPARRAGNSGFNTQGVRMAAPDDPNGYRSPGFQDYNNREPYRIDYAGLPKDDDESDGQAAMLGGIRPASLGGPLGGNAPLARGPAPGGRGPGAPRAAAALPRGLNGRRPDRAGTDPDAYRSPGFTAEPQAPHTGPSRRERRAQRPRFEAACAECGAPALVPFMPAPDRPAFCKPCYQIKKPLLDLGPGKGPRPVSADALPTDDSAPTGDSPAT